MRSLLAGALLACTALAGSSPPAAAQSDGDIFPFETRRFDLDNGLRTYLIHAGSPGMLAYVSVVRTGAREEVEEGVTGFAHFFEHMMFRGTKKYPNYDGVTESFGANRNANTSQDRTFYYLVAGSEYLERIVDLESDRFRNLSYAEPAFRTEAGAVLGEYQNNAYSAFSVLDRAVREKVFTTHTYRHQVIGFEPDVRDMPNQYRYSLDFFRRFYRPENVVLLVVGDFDFDQAESLIRAYYGGWEPGYVPPAVPVEPEQTEPRRDAVTYPGRTLPMVTLNWMAPAWSATDRQAVALELLGGIAFGPNSPIYRRLVVQERRLQALQAGFALSRDPDFVQVLAMVTDPADVQAIEAELLAEVERYQTELVDERTLADTRSAARYRFLMGLEAHLNVANAVSRAVVNTGALEPINDYYRTLRSITPEDLRRAAERILTERNRTIVTLVQEGGS
ncbi:MAG: pitrilysin family protein [Longimicrobiales bacterium]|nr:pitrilysin family protein [Longimicrobiales bacterium]